MRDTRGATCPQMQEDWDAKVFLTSWLRLPGRRKDGEEKERMMGKSLIGSRKQSPPPISSANPGAL